jgi:drug/metabolite transporter (DMT)-like permease
MPFSALRATITSAYTLLLLTAFLWGGNAVASRLVVGEASPMVVVATRWLIVGLILAVIARQDLAEGWSVLKPRWRYVVVMAIFGFTGFNSLFYISGHFTTAVNIAIIQGSMPAFILLGGVLFLRQTVGWLQYAGTAVTLVGVAVLATAGDLSRILELAFNYGDALVIAACVFYSAYTVGLRRRPAVSGLAFFTVMAGVALLTSLPLLAAEMALGKAQWPTPTGWAIILYIALGPSLAAQLLFMKGVDMIGPIRAGLFVNLVPVFGALLAVLILEEAFLWYHAAALLMVLAGIGIAESRRSAAGR